MTCLYWLSIVLFVNITFAENATKPFKHTNVHAGNKGPHMVKDSAGREKARQGGTLPTVFIIGVQKGGSSSLYQLMVQHPQLCGGAHKENHFFDHPDNYERGTPYFKAMFFDEKCDGKAGTHFLEGTPILHYPSVWQRIYDTYSETPQIRDKLKFIVMLREPVARDYSWYEHMTRTDIYLGEKFHEVKTMNETFDGNSTFFRKGRYIEQLQAFTKNFRRDQIMVLSSTGIFKNTQVIMENIRKFIDVKEHESFDVPLPHDDHLRRMSRDGVVDCITAHVPQLDCWVRDTMREHFVEYNNQLYTWLNKTRSIASPHEPLFSPEFPDPKLLPCSKDARKAFNKILAVDAMMKPPKNSCEKPASKEEEEEEDE